MKKDKLESTPPLEGHNITDPVTALAELDKDAVMGEEQPAENVVAMNAALEVVVDADHGDETHEISQVETTDNTEGGEVDDYDSGALDLLCHLREEFQGWLDSGRTKGGSKATQGIGEVIAYLNEIEAKFYESQTEIESE